MEVPNVKDFQWKRLAPLPSRRVYCSLLESGGQVYAIGGCDDNGIPMDCFEVYSPEADQWTALPPLPTARAGVAAIALGKRIMVIGGVGTSQLPLKVVEMYNIDEGKWKKRSVLREAAMGISVTAKDYRVYAAGGMGLDLRPHSHLQHYDMLKDMWVSLAPMPTPRYAATSFLRGCKIYVLGGRQSKYAVNAFEVFDIETRSWTKFPNIPCKRAFSSFVTLDDRLYSLGGLRQGRLYRQPKFLRTMDVFDMEQGGWLKMERSFFLKKRRADFVAGSLSGRVIVAGGLGSPIRIQCPRPWEKGTGLELHFQMGLQHLWEACSALVTNDHPTFVLLIHSPLRLAPPRFPWPPPLSTPSCSCMSTSRSLPTALHPQPSPPAHPSHRC